MLISQVFILTPRGERIVFKDYMKDAPPNADEIFFRTYKFWDGTQRSQTNHQAPEGDCPPFFTENNVHYCFVKRSELLFVCTSLTNASPSLALDILFRIVGVIKDFLGLLSEKAVRKNFTLVYELLDEVLDLGVPQELSTGRLRPYVFSDIVPVGQNSLISMDYLIDHLGIGEILEQTRCSEATETSVVKAFADLKNEIYVDLVERLQVVFDSAGRVVVAAVDGSIVVKSFLVGTPVVRLLLGGGFTGKGRGDSPLLDCVNFHDSVNYDKFESERLLTFHPPEGEYTLMSYRCGAMGAPMPFYLVHSLIVLAEQQVELTLRLRTSIPMGRHAINVTITVPTPKACIAAVGETRPGAPGQTLVYKKEENRVVWSIQKFFGGVEEVCNVRFTTSSAVRAEIRRELSPLSMEFEIPHHNLTGLSVEALDIAERSDTYNPSRWIRNIVLGDSYQFRAH